jgi:hypothetical protein
MTGDERDPKLPAGQSGRSDIDAFLQKVAATPVQPKAGQRGRLLFAVDATASREPTWDMACQIQSEMFTSSDELVRRMQKVRCLAGRTQIRKLLRHTLKETRQHKVDALVFVGDVVEEDIDELGHQAGELGLVGTPVFVFHEGGEPISRRAFEQIARLSGGAYCSFDAGSAQQLRDLLAAVAVFSAGGRRALADLGKARGGRVLQIADQMRGKR